MKQLEMEAHKVYSDFYRMSGREQRKHYRGYKKEINRIANIEECGLKLCKEKEIHSNDVGFLKYLIIIYVLTMLVAIIYAIILSL